jgi:hypothetical protein
LVQNVINKSVVLEQAHSIFIREHTNGKSTNTNVSSHVILLMRHIQHF